jgi:hypothetical protein
MSLCSWMVRPPKLNPHFLQVGTVLLAVHVCFHWCAWPMSPNILEAAQRLQLCLTHFCFLKSPILCCTDSGVSETCGKYALAPSNTFCNF